MLKIKANSAFYLSFSWGLTWAELGIKREHTKMVMKIIKVCLYKGCGVSSFPWNCSVAVESLVGSLTRGGLSCKARN